MKVFLLEDWNQCKAGSIVSVTEDVGNDIIIRKIGVLYTDSDIILWTPNFNICF